MSKSGVKFSGTDYGLLMRLEWETSFPQLLVELEEHLQQSLSFFSGAQVFLEVGQRPILQQDMEQLTVVFWQGQQPPSAAEAAACFWPTRLADHNDAVSWS